jgi:hypothetical protein
MSNPNPHKNIPLDKGSSAGLPYIEVVADLNLSANQKTDAVASGVYVPAYCDVVNVTFFVEDAVESAGNALTFAMGTDSASDPDNFLNDEAEANIDADNDKVDGIPRLGTDNTKIAYTEAAQVYWKCGTEAPTAGRIRAKIYYLPY